MTDRLKTVIDIDPTVPPRTIKFEFDVMPTEEELRELRKKHREGVVVPIGKPWGPGTFKIRPRLFPIRLMRPHPHLKNND